MIAIVGSLSVIGMRECQCNAYFTISNLYYKSLGAYVGRTVGVYRISLLHSCTYPGRSSGFRKYSYFRDQRFTQTAANAAEFEILSRHLGPNRGVHI